MRQLVDETGSVALAQTFDPYGDGYATSGSASSSLGWTGEQVDGNGFVYLRARYYSPGMGRFTQMDPSRLENNPYQYSAGNPVMFVDPSGLWWWGNAENEYEEAVVEWYMKEVTGQLDGGITVHAEFNVSRHVLKDRRRAIRSELARMGASTDLNRPVDLLEIRGREVIMWEIKELRWKKQNQRPLDSAKNVGILEKGRDQAKKDFDVMTAAAKVGALNYYYTTGPFDNVHDSGEHYQWNHLQFTLGDDFPSGSFTHDDGTLVVFEQADRTLYPGVVQVWAIDQKQSDNVEDLVKLLIAMGASAAAIAAAKEAAAAGLTRVPPTAGGYTCVPFLAYPAAAWCMLLTSVDCEFEKEMVLN